MTSPVSAVDAIEKAMEGVTPGPWKAEGYVVMGDWHASGGIASVRSGARAFNDAEFIAACSPDRMREVLTLARQAEAVKRENAELRKMVTDCCDALIPFADAVFNDNGDMTVNLACASGDDLIKAYFVHRRARTLLKEEANAE